MTKLYNKKGGFVSKDDNPAADSPDHANDQETKRREGTQKGSSGILKWTIPVAALAAVLLIAVIAWRLLTPSGGDKKNAAGGSADHFTKADAGSQENAAADDADSHENGIGTSAGSDDENTGEDTATNFKSKIIDI